MPLVKVELIIRNESEKLEATTVPRLAAALGRCLQSPPGETWLRLYYLSSAQYAENDEALPESVRPTFVEVLKHRTPAPEVLAQEAQQLASTVAEVLERPRENVHIVYAADGVDRVAFGGQLQRSDGAD